MHCSRLRNDFARRLKQHSSSSIIKKVFNGGNDMRPNRYFSGVDTSVTKAFDRELKKKQRDNAARSRRAWKSAAVDDVISSSSVDATAADDDDIVDYEYFRQEMAIRLVDRLDDIKVGFPLALDVGAGSGQIYRAICSDDAFEGEGGIGGVRKMVLLDSSDEMLHVNDDDDKDFEGSHRCDAYKLHSDEEEKLPFPDGTFDIVMSSQSIHWVNDLPKLFQEAFRVLKPNGCFMFSMIGGECKLKIQILENSKVET